MPKRWVEGPAARFVAWIGVSIFCGAFSGAIAAIVVTPAPTISVPVVSTTSTKPLPVTPTSTDIGPSLVPVATRASISLVPPSVLTRRASPVASIYRKAKGITVDERTLGDDRLLGQAVALTSDGWFLTDTLAIGTMNLTELTLWHAGKAYAIERGLVDHLNGTAYLKVAATELPTPAFGDVTGLVAGAQLWIERRSGSYVPTLITAIADKLPAPDPASSEVVVRRIRLDGVTEKADLGAPVWDDRGALIGIIESAEGSVPRIVPATSLASSFAFLLSGGEIRHAKLGVRGTDLSAWRIDGARGNLPTRGVLLKDDRKTGKLAIVKDSPAAKAGLKAGDVIVSIERDILDGSADLGEVLSEYRADTPVTIHYLREGVPQDVTLTLGGVVTSELIN